ncbi:MAG: hypothetical protein Q8941_18705 [Bacteroidota bacterium]|nr:hypothetical protein [Bacteroidota bacterium]
MNGGFDAAWGMDGFFKADPEFQTIAVGRKYSKLWQTREGIESYEPLRAEGLLFNFSPKILFSFFLTKKETKKVPATEKWLKITA